MINYELIPFVNRIYHVIGDIHIVSLLVITQQLQSYAENHIQNRNTVLGITCVTQLLLLKRMPETNNLKGRKVYFVSLCPRF